MISFELAFSRNRPGQVMGRGRSRSIVRAGFIYSLNLFCRVYSGTWVFIVVYAGPIHIQCLCVSCLVDETMFIWHPPLLLVLLIWFISERYFCQRKRNELLSYIYFGHKHKANSYIGNLLLKPEFSYRLLVKNITVNRMRGSRTYLSTLF